MLFWCLGKYEKYSRKITSSRWETREVRCPFRLTVLQEIEGRFQININIPNTEYIYLDSKEIRRLHYIFSQMFEDHSFYYEQLHSKWCRLLDLYTGR